MTTVSGSGVGLARLAAGWRIACFGSAAALCVLAYLVLFSMLSHGTESQLSRFAFLAPLLLSCALLWLNRVFLIAEGSDLSAIGLERPVRRIPLFCAGFGGGFLLVVLWALIMTACMGLHWRRGGMFDLRESIPLILFTFFLGMSEELAYRGYALVRISRSAGPLAAILTTSIVFTLLHIQGGLAWLNAFAGVFTCAVVYAVLFERTRSLPLALGFHVANNVAQNMLGLRETPLTLFEPMRAPVSGQSLTLALVAVCNLVAAMVLWRLLPGSAGRRGADLLPSSRADAA